VSGREAYERYASVSGGVSLVNGDLLPTWSELPENIKAAWEAADGPRPALTEIRGVKASRCQFGTQLRHHTALRFVWHHILPQAAGGKTETSNLAELCDNCHYSVHVVLWALARGQSPPKEATTDQFTLANTGYQLAVQAGTVGKIPRED
jgi:HNH endonuclease